MMREDFKKGGKTKDPRLKRAGVSGYNKPKRTPKHRTKSHVVVAKEGSKVKLIRFGQQGKTGDRTMTKRAKSFKARHGKNIRKGKMSAAYWANKVKWWWLKCFLLVYYYCFHCTPMQTQRKKQIV